MPVATASSVINRVIVSSTSVSGIAVIQKDPSGRLSARTRYRRSSSLVAPLP